MYCKVEKGRSAGQGHGECEARNGWVLPTSCCVPSPTSAPAKRRNIGEIPSHPAALLHSVPVQMCLVSRKPDLRLGKLCLNTASALGWGMTEWLAPAWSAVGFAESCGWQCRTCPLREGVSVSLCLGQLGSCRGGTAMGSPAPGSLHLSLAEAGSNHTKPQKKAAWLHAACSLKPLSFIGRSLKSACWCFWKYVTYWEICPTLNHGGSCVKNQMRRKQGQSAHCGLCHG